MNLSDKDAQVIQHLKDRNDSAYNRQGPNALIYAQNQILIAFLEQTMLLKNIVESVTSHGQVVVGGT